MFKILVAEDDASTNRLFCAILRRARIVDERKITAGDVVLDYDAHTVRRGHEVQTLPPQGVQPALQAAGLPRPDVYPAAIAR